LYYFAAAGYGGYSCTSGAVALGHILHFILTGHFGGDIYINGGDGRRKSLDLCS
jgi:hypothetical protein